MSLQDAYQDFDREATTGYLHQGGKCSGWFVSDLDTFHWCGVCNRGGERKENPEVKADREAQEANDQAEQCLTGITAGKGKFVVFAPFDGGMWAHFMTSNYAQAARWAVGYAKANKVSVKIRKVVGKEELDHAEYQCDRLLEWASDAVIYE